MYLATKASRSASFSDTDISALQGWSEEERRNVCLTFCIDSQNLTVALCPLRNTKKAIYLNSVRVNKAQDVKDNYEFLRNAFGRNNCTVVYSTMSFAGPISQDHVVITNWQCDARDRVIHFTSLPFDLFPLDRRRFMNDLEAASYGLLAKDLRVNSLDTIFSPLWETPSSSKTITLRGSSCVILIGDGLGVSYINRHVSSEHNCVVSSEAGHAQCYISLPSSPKYAKECELIRFVSHKLHGGSHQPEWEDMCSFRGGELIYQFVKPETAPIGYNQIRELAIGGDHAALKAFKIHYKFIMRAIQSMVLGVRCKKVFIISEAQVKNSVLMKQFSDKLKRTFQDHPRSDWLKKVTIYGQVINSQFGLSGGLFLSNIFADTIQKFSHTS
ncbi:putative glucokinase 2 [Histomonas meleagridis]|uniref:putative glucokinase 2 n=1 Tax=Histomonas meleagridis TaxID=135588 RepID=UPI003559A543|nr:putative glucokinase 2 [Histomonas meleagridis]KAH0806570.1 putative glucokinase 2 [Histomonas meleagridis]